MMKESLNFESGSFYLCARQNKILSGLFILQKHKQCQKSVKSHRMNHQRRQSMNVKNVTDRQKRKKSFVNLKNYRYVALH